ncbi:lipopolysaccharide biosynthesis protein [Plectonema cf. radiosum LEGE 06105]|uniref:Lipopolysaccharide biosynthesis protein n=1 Tax=Plectonema cf. radiosum LEGE 06105 TaxID=945769 RepID=A0A8J7JX24_9CYAN|nr:lipopolysaccharide biosynthesis protein [Plectonema radiosum]MBE9216250.1 lipopolysaccharide biosynthesis protein [Plectonema cf. radiosum LEGE 06105]
MKNISSNHQSDKYFCTDHLKADLKGRSVRGGVITMTAQALKFILTLGSNVILARLLTPQDYGLVGMVTAVIGFVSIFKDLGLSMATIQKEEINHEQVSTLFWVNVALSIAIALLTIALAPGIAWFYKEPRLIWITIALASGFILSGLGVQHSALLNRQMQYRALMVNDIISMLSGVFAAIVSVFYGIGYWALIILPIVISFVSTVGYWIICSWRPGLPRRVFGVGSMLAFGGNLTGFTIINYFARNLDNILIGRYWGSQELGLYAKAYQLMVLPLSQINAPIANVVIPTLSRLQEEPEKFRQYYLKALSFIVFITIPSSLFMMVMAQEIIIFILGPQWYEAAVIFQALSLSAIIQPIYNTSGWLYMATGKTSLMLKFGGTISILLVCSFLIGLPYKAQGVAFCYAIALIFLSIPAMYYAIQRTSITLMDLLNVIKKPLIASLMGSIATFAVKTVIGLKLPLIITILASFMAMITIYILTMFYLFEMKNFYLNIFQSFRQK